MVTGGHAGPRTSGRLWLSVCELSQLWESLPSSPLLAGVETETQGGAVMHTGVTNTPVPGLVLALYIRLPVSTRLCPRNVSLLVAWIRDSERGQNVPNTT